MTGTASSQSPQLGGMHHVSALSAHINRSHDFYTRVLGLRPLIKTVNQDDTRMYHLFYGDGAGSPGSDMTVFDMPHSASEHHGNNSISRTTFRVSGEPALAYWALRLTDNRVTHEDAAVRDGHRVLDFDDFEGTQLSLVDDRGVGEAHPWHESPVPAEYQIRGLGYVVITVPELTPTDRFLTQALGLRRDHSYQLADAPRYQVHVYAIGDSGAHAGAPLAVNTQLHVAVRDDLPRARYGAGGVHHLALRVPEGQKIADWLARIDSLGYRNSGIVDRHYFTSVYVREPNHVLFELATDAPGFEVDGPIDVNRLSLPPFLEPRREEIESMLQPLSTARDSARAGR
ncbi:MAG: VOC family protein [Gemmatimonadales bacterium]